MIYFDDRTIEEIMEIESIDQRYLINGIEVYGVYLDCFFVRIVTELEEAKHLCIEYDLKYEHDCRRLNKMHSIYTFSIGELANVNGIIMYSYTSEMLEALGEFPQIKWM